MLVGKALEEDQQFWNSGLFQVGSDDQEQENSDDDYNSKEESASAGKDSFDSDFDQPDNDLEGKDDGSDEGKARKGRRAPVDSDDEERMLNQQEKKDKLKRKVTFEKKLDGASKNRREQKVIDKQPDNDADLN